MKKHRKLKISQVFIYLGLSLWALTTIYPFLWVILNSFKPKNQIISQSFALPIGELFTLNNYKTAFNRMDIGGAYLRSIGISLTVTVVVVLLAGMAAYALARYRFRGKQICYSLVLAGMMFPVFSTIIPVFRMEHAWGIVNTSNVFLSMLSVALPQIAGNLCFAIIILTGYIKDLPVDLEEAAYLDGCNIFQVFFKVIVPLTKPSFATVAIFSFLWSYNDLFSQQFFLRNKQQYPITMLLAQLTSREGTNYGLMAAAVALVVVPVLVVYIFMQKHIIKGLTAGAIKG